MNLQSLYIFMVEILWFQNCKTFFLCVCGVGCGWVCVYSVTCCVHIDHGTGHMLGWERALTLTGVESSSGILHNIMSIIQLLLSKDLLLYFSGFSNFIIQWCDLNGSSGFPTNRKVCITLSQRRLNFRCGNHTCGNFTILFITS